MDPVSKAQAEKPKKRVVGRPFPKGVSGNPKGRPPGPQPWKELYTEIIADPKVRAAVKQQIISTMTTKGMAGVLERREAAERVEGKVAQEVNMAVTGKLTLEQVLNAKKKAGK